MRVIQRSYLWDEGVRVGDLGGLEPVLDALGGVHLSVASDY